MTLEEAKAILAPILEAERVLLADAAAKQRAKTQEQCDRGDHLWEKSDPRAVHPYCRVCGEEK